MSPDLVSLPLATVHGDPTRVGALIGSPFLTIELAESLWDAWQLMFVSGLQELIVLDRDGTCIGILTDRTILTGMPLTRESLEQRTVGEVLSRIPIALIRTTALPGEAAALMSASLVDVLPVLDPQDRLVGVLTASDIVRWLSSTA